MVIDMHKKIIILTILVMLLVAIPVSGLPEYSEHMTGPLQNDCTLCHTNNAGGGDRNSFGKDFAQHNHIIEGALSSMDSDNDGYNNSIELEAGTYPADRTSYPDSDLAKAHALLLEEAAANNNTNPEPELYDSTSAPETITENITTEDATDEVDETGETNDDAPVEDNGSSSPLIPIIVGILLVIGTVIITLKK